MDYADIGLKEVATLISARLKLNQEGTTIQVFMKESVPSKWKDIFADILERMAREFDLFNSLTDNPLDMYPIYDEALRAYRMNIDLGKMRELMGWLDEAEQREIEKSKIFQVGDVKLDLVRGLLKIGEVEKPISQMERTMKLLTLLLSNSEVIQPYIKIAIYVGIVGKEEDMLDGDPDMERSVQYVRNKLRKYLIENAGFSVDSVEKVMLRIDVSSGLGYVYRLNNN